MEWTLIEQMVRVVFAAACLAFALLCRQLQNMCPHLTNDIGQAVIGHTLYRMNIYLIKVHGLVCCFLYYYNLHLLKNARLGSNTFLMELLREATRNLLWGSASRNLQCFYPLQTRPQQCRGIRRCNVGMLTENCAAMWQCGTKRDCNAE